MTRQNTFSLQSSEETPGRMMWRFELLRRLAFGGSSVLPLLIFLFYPAIIAGEDCRITPVFHVLQLPGCDSITIPSFACQGKCTSYVQVSGSKLWEMERSCMCCQESGVREATVTLSCPKAASGSPKFQKVVTKAPVDCMCRPCTAVDEGSILPQEMVGFMGDGRILSMYSH